MARMKVIVKDTGKKGTIDINDFDPSKFTPDYNLGQKIATSSLAPVLGSMAGGVLGGIPGAAVGAGAVYGLQNTLKYLTGLKDYPKDWGEAKKQTVDYSKGVATEGAKGAVSEAGGRAVGWVGGKLLGPVIGKVKGWLPSSMSKSIEANKTVIGEKISEVIKNSGNKNLSLDETLAALEKIKLQPQVEVNPNALSSVDDVINLVKSTGGNAKSGFGVKVGFGQDIYGESGKELMKRGTAGITEKMAKQTAGEGLGTALKTQIPGLDKLMEQYSQFAKLGNRMQKPLSLPWSYFLPSIAANMINPQIALPVTGAAAAASMPYTNLLGRKLIGGAMSNPLTTYGTKAGLYGLENLIFPPNNQNSDYSEYGGTK